MLYTLFWSNPSFSHQRFKSSFDSIVFLGLGGFGHVFKARNILLNKEMAVKIVPYDEWVDGRVMGKQWQEQKLKTLCFFFPPLLQESWTRGQGVIRPHSPQYYSVLHVLVGEFRIQLSFLVSPARWTFWPAGQQHRFHQYFPCAWILDESRAHN